MLIHIHTVHWLKHAMTSRLHSWADARDVAISLEYRYLFPIGV